MIKSITTVVLTVLLSSAAFAFPSEGVECTNGKEMSDSYMAVKISEGVAVFKFWETETVPIQITASGVDTFAIVEEKVRLFGEGLEWLDIVSAFMVYKPETDELSVTTVFGNYGTTEEVLSCSPIVNL